MDRPTVVCLSRPNTDSSLIDTVSRIAQNYEKAVKHVTVGNDGDSIKWSNVTVTIAIGGDGTFLEGVRLTAPSGTPLLGVNTGTLGFLSRIPPSALAAALDVTLAGESDVIEREMLAVGGEVSGIGINDVMLEPVPPESPVDRKVATIHAYIDDEYVGEFTGSGIAVATPTGSTAVAFSAGGPVHYPNANSSLQLTPLHTHNAGVRPVIVDSDTVITLLPDDEIDVAIDGGRTHATIGEGTELTVTGADQSARIVRTEFDESFFDSMAGKLGWGIRGVDEPGPREPDSV